MSRSIPIGHTTLASDPLSPHILQDVGRFFYCWVRYTGETDSVFVSLFISLFVSAVRCVLYTLWAFGLGWA